MKYLYKFFGHLHTINKHRWKVFQLCLKAHIPLQGLTHDLSKYSPVEFFEGVKYYTNGKHSPIVDAKKDLGYSNAWLHHKGKNKHHHEYWYDYSAPNKTPVIPLKYSIEMICDMVAAAKIYQGKNYTNMSAYYYWNKVRDDTLINKNIQSFITEVLELLGAHGEKVVINKKYLTRIYIKHINRKEKENE